MQCKAGTTYVLSPTLDQAVAIVTMLRSHFTEREYVGVTMPGEAAGRLPAPYVRSIRLKDFHELREEVYCIPTGSSATRTLLQCRDLTLGDVTLTQPALRFYDKVWSIDSARRAGVPVPRTWTSAKEATYPLFFKSRKEGDGIRGIAFSASDLAGLPDDDLVFQEFIDSRGTYGVAFIAAEGSLRLTHTHFEPESYPKEGGSAVEIENFEDDRLVEYARRIVGMSKYSGWGLVEFKYCPRRQNFVFMELNAKFWASCEFTFLNEPRFPEMLFGLPAVGKRVNRMVFLHRAAARGPSVLLRYLGRGALSDSELRFSSRGILRPIVSGLIPRTAHGAKRLRD